MTSAFEEKWSDVNDRPAREQLELVPEMSSDFQEFTSACVEKGFEDLMDQIDEQRSL
jgi:hypothetical protein